MDSKRTIGDFLTYEYHNAVPCGEFTFELAPSVDDVRLVPVSVYQLSETGEALAVKPLRRGNPFGYSDK